MNKIKVMSEDLSNKIAAGEVVERIANVVKELVENSLDASASSIKIELVSAGTKMIKITDNGEGMNKEDAKSAFLRHATSKISKLDDLFFINSLGFRGEALPSIASVSKVTLTTSKGQIGTKIIINGGSLVDESSSDSRLGTIILVEDLFYNTPARLKYLKTEQTELANTTNFIEKLALSYDNVAFNLINNGTNLIKTSGSGNLLKTIHEIYGLEISKNMIKINGSNNDFDITGFICKPAVLKSTRNYITTIVNNRVVKNSQVNKYINDAYFTYKPSNKFPVVIMKIETDPTLIDVNIHPTKQDIKFSKINSLEKLVYSSVKDSLYRALLIPEIIHEDPDRDYHQGELEYVYNLGDADYLNKVNDTQESFNFDEDLKNSEIKTLELHPAGLVFGTYIVAQNVDAMYLVDQHAAEERVNYEKILNSLKLEEISVISMLVPINIELTPSDYLIINENIHLLENVGFIIEEFGINTISIKSHPTWLIEGYEEESIKKIIEFLLVLPKEFDLAKFNDKLAATAACKLSVKGNTSITIDQMQSILNKLVKCDNPYNCPHGRPTIISFTKYELDKMFKRVMS